MWFGMTAFSMLCDAGVALLQEHPVVVLRCWLQYCPVLKASCVQMVTDTAVMITFPGNRCCWTEESLKGVWFRCMLYTGIGVMDKAAPEVTLKGFATRYQALHHDHGFLFLHLYVAYIGCTYIEYVTVLLYFLLCLSQFCVTERNSHFQWPEVHCTVFWYVRYGRRHLALVYILC